MLIDEPPGEHHPVIPPMSADRAKLLDEVVEQKLAALGISEDEIGVIKIPTDKLIIFLRFKMAEIETRMRKSANIVNDLTELAAAFAYNGSDRWRDKVLAERDNIDKAELADIAHKIPVVQAIFLNCVMGVEIIRRTSFQGDVTIDEKGTFDQLREQGDEVTIDVEKLDMRIMKRLSVILPMDEGMAKSKPSTATKAISYTSEVRLIVEAVGDFYGRFIKEGEFEEIVRAVKRGEALELSVNEGPKLDNFAIDAWLASLDNKGGEVGK